MADMSWKNNAPPGTQLENTWKGERKGLGSHEVTLHALMVQNFTPVCPT